MFVDSHSHVDSVEFDADREEVLWRAREAGVCAVVAVGTGDPRAGDLEHAIELASKHDFVFATAGVHPHDAKLFDAAAEATLRELLKRPRVVALGEIGLDYHYDNSPRDAQRAAFRRQLRIAREMNLPVVIHTREAEADTIEILREFYETNEEAQGNGESNVNESDSTAVIEQNRAGGVMHCFSGSLALAEATLALGFMISFAGVVTFKKAEELREVARRVPLNRMLIETDCPYLAPAPFRGKRNEPAFVVEIARFLAELRGVSFEEFGKATTENFARLFRVEI